MLPALPIIFEHMPGVVLGLLGSRTGIGGQCSAWSTRDRQAKLAELLRKSNVNDVKCLQVCDDSEPRQGRLVWQGKGNECLGNGWLKRQRVSVSAHWVTSRKKLASSSLRKGTWMLQQ